MGSQINTLILGAGNFGKHYVRILSRLNRKGLANIPTIDKLVITKTQLKRAQDLADNIRCDDKCSANKVIGAEANNTQDVVGLLEQYNPQFVCITARDQDLGDTIHAIYTTYALRYGAVLCEKPFSNATGDGSSLSYFDDLFDYDNSALFGLELPLAVVTRDLMQHKDLGDLFANARHMEFYWGRGRSGEYDILDDLALHPWSLIPQEFKIEPLEVDHRGSKTNIDITVRLYNQHTRKDIICKMMLHAEGDFRGVMVDDCVIGIKVKGTSIKLIQLDKSLEDGAKLGNDALCGNVLLQVDNPLEQNIIASLQGKAIVGLRRARDSQLFLERLHGYVPSS